MPTDNPTSPTTSTQQPAAMPLAIESHGLSKRFGKRLAVNEVSLCVPRGKTYGLIGLNGAGKSTAIKMLVGLVPPTSGRAIIGGIDIWQDRVHALSQVGYVPDRPNVYPWMRIGDAIAFSKQVWPSWDDSVAFNLIGRYCLDVQQRIGTLSKGQGAKVSLLLALCHNPSILILDEPTDGLDPLSRDDFLEEVLESVMNDEQERTIFLSSHSLGDVQKMTDHVGLMHDGQLQIQCATDELVQNTKRIRAVLRDGAAPPRAPKGTLLARTKGREWFVTVRDLVPQTLAQLHSSNLFSHIEVIDLSLDDIFKDFARGQNLPAPLSTAPPTRSPSPPSPLTPPHAQEAAA